MTADLPIEFHGVALELCPERAAFRPERLEVLVSDVHLGKAAAFRRAGRPIPPGTTQAELARLDQLIERKGAKRLTILGDLLHHELAADSPTALALGAWLGARESSIGITLIRGNHDRHASALLDDLPLACAPEPELAGDLAYRHHPGGDVPFVAGHIHPGIRLEHGFDGGRLPVFWEQARGLILPAFGSFTGLQIIEAGPQDRLAVATPTGVVRLPRAATSSLR